MLADVEAPTLRIESNRPRDRLDEQALIIEREFPLENVVRRNRLFAQRGDQRNEVRLQAREHGRDAIGCHTGLIVLEQPIVSLANPAKRIGLLSRQPEYPLDPGRESLEVVVGARIGPDLRRKCGHACPLLHQLPRQPTLAIEIPPELAHVHGMGALGVVDERGPFDGAEQLIEARIGRPIVSQSGDQRHLLSAMPDAAARHVDLRVPLQQSKTRLEHAFLARESHQLGVCLIGIQVAARCAWVNGGSFSVQRPGGKVLAARACRHATSSVVASSRDARGSYLQGPAKRRLLPDYMARPYYREYALATRGEIYQSAYHVVAAYLTRDVSYLEQQRHALGVRQSSPIRRPRELLSPVCIEVGHRGERTAEPGCVRALAQQMQRERVAVAVVPLCLAGEDPKCQVCRDETWLELPQQATDLGVVFRLERIEGYPAALRENAHQLRFAERAGCRSRCVLEHARPTLTQSHRRLELRP